MSKVTVIIPNYNHARFLEKRLDSILNQTYQDFEVIFLDDASTDNSKEVFTKYASHPKISKVIFNEQNSGSPFKQWNKGVKEAKGEYLWIAESDDYADLTFLANLVPILDNNPNVGIVYCQSIKVDENNKEIANGIYWHKKLDEQRWKNSFINKGKDEVNNYFIYQNNIMNASGVLIRKQAYLQSGIAPEYMTMTGDWYFYLSILRDYDVCFLNKNLNYHRWHSQVSRNDCNKNKLWLRCIEEYQVLEFILENFEISSESLKKSSWYYQKRWYDEMLLTDLLINRKTWQIINYYRQLDLQNEKEKKILNIIAKIISNTCKVIIIPISELFWKNLWNLTQKLGLFKRKILNLFVD